MNTKEAIMAMLEGKKARIKNWSDKTQFLYFNENGFFYSNGDRFGNFSLYEEWEIYEPPVTFGEVKPGQRFKYNGSEYIKVEEFIDKTINQLFNSYDTSFEIYKKLDDKQVLDRIL